MYFEIPPTEGSFLAMDCSGEILCVGIMYKGRTAEIGIDAGLRHAELLMPVVDRLMAELGMHPSELNGIICGKGPGSFTGIRIAMASAKGIAESLGIPMISIPAFIAMARKNRHWPGLTVPLIDAKKNRWYAGFFKAGSSLHDTVDADVSAITELARNLSAQSGSVLLTGPGAADFYRVVETAGTFETGIFTIDAAARTSWASALLEAGIEKLSGGMADLPDEGPQYIRVSDAELGITTPKRPPLEEGTIAK